MPSTYWPDVAMVFGVRCVESITDCKVLSGTCALLWPACAVICVTSTAGAHDKADAIRPLAPASLAHNGRKIAHAVYQQAPAHSRLLSIT